MMDHRYFSNICWRLRAYAAVVVPTVVGMGILGGCAGEKKPAVTQTPPASLMSQQAGSDLNAKASTEADRQLTQAQWTVLQGRGPKPRGVASPGKSSPMIGGTPLKALTAPTTQPLNEAELPVTTVTLPDGKLKLIWVLRSYGGSTVTSTRDATTNRRQMAIAAPDLTALVTVLSQQIGPTGAVVPLPSVNTLVVTCDAAQKASVLAMLNDLDRPQRQVEITAKIFEVSQDFDYQQGANLMLSRIHDNNSQSGISTFNTDAFKQETAAKGGQVSNNGSVINLMQASTSAGLSLDAAFQLMSEIGLIKVVSSPRMTVAVGQTGYMLAGQELPIQSANLVNGILQTATTYKPVGVQLYITPQAVSDDLVKLHTVSIVSSISGFSPMPTLVGGTNPNAMVNPIIDSREAETAVTIQDGATLVISGLRMIRTTSREQKVPGLGDVPLLGEMFKNHRSQQQMTDLYFFVTPTLL